VANAAGSRFSNLSAYALSVLAERGDIEPPIRAELFGAQRFEQHGRSLAAAQIVRPFNSRAKGRLNQFFPRVTSNIAALRRAYDYIAITSRSGHYVTPAADWLLDNFHLIESQLQQIQEGVPHRYYAELPKLADEPLDGLPRVYGIAWAYVAHTDSVLDPVLFTAFLHAYQEVSELTLGELWALPTTLRVVLLENLRRMADRIARNKVAREVAHAVWDSPTALRERDLDELLAQMHSLGLARSFLTQLWQRMPAERTEQRQLVCNWTDHHCPDALTLISEGQNAQVEANLTVSNVITTLRTIGQVDWAELIEPVSHSLQVLRRVPSYSRESELTRQQITRAMERLAQRSGHSERKVAEAVLQAARQSNNSMAARTAGYYLIGPGRPVLEALLDPEKPPARAEPVGQTHRSWRLPLYGAVWLLGTVALVYGAEHFRQGPPWAVWLALALLVWPASEIVAALIQRLIAESTRIQPLARLDFNAGIPPEHRVLVVVPAMLTSVASNAELAHRLSLHWLASREKHAQFALLSDWADAPTETVESDSALLEDMRSRLRVLNRSYPAAAGSAPRFALLHRRRSWSASENKWIGWERKRGKLEQLVRQLAGGPASAFMALSGDARLAEGTRYIVTLDSDTTLPAGALQELVAIAAHPLNAPYFDAKAGRVTAGYGILQPRVVTPITGAHERSPYHAMFAGEGGLDPYSNGSADLYQDLFGLGTFTGKGLLHVAAVHAALDQRLPEGSILSHDLLEGSIARCGYVGDVALIEDHPHHAGVAASRLHRWTRGDWQLLPMMLRARHFGIDALGLWRMADNLRRSLIPPVCALLLVMVIFTDALPLWLPLTMTILAFLTGPLLGAAAGLVPTRRGISLLHFFHVGLGDVLRSVTASLWQLSQLVIHAGLLVDALGRALWRMLVSRKKLLEWTTAAQAQAQADYALPTFFRKHWLSTALCLALAVAALLSDSPTPWADAGLFGLWAAGPLWAWWASRPVTAPAAGGLDLEQQSYLHELALQTWQLFDRCVGPEDNHLPPDNLQVDAEATVAHRTSPTNIGLYLLTTLCARTFGLITVAEAISRLEATINTVERMPKHNGHLYNWYETRTLEVLQPAYVSTVDSGNLAGHLLAAGEGCKELAVSPQTPAECASLLRLAERCERLCMAMDFSGLYSQKRHLFHIGLRVYEQALDASYYDLLASESRLISFLAIAKGDVPRRHWQALGRNFLSVGITPGLKSWSGSMFEYLMPSLVMREPENGLLHISGLAAVREQQAFGRQQKLPWGVSESAYFAQDHSLAFQYSPFGVPRLALRRTPQTDRVVAPYATVLGCLFTPHEAVANLQALEKLGARGDCGFFDAVDFTVARQPDAQAFSVVKNFMAHHQGMSVVALCNLLCDDAPRRWFARAPLVQAYESLLHEKAPRQIVESADPRTLPELDESRRERIYHSREIDPAVREWQPTQLLSNGRYSVALRANGAGLSRWRWGGRTTHITRWRDDLLRDEYGSFIYLKPLGEAASSVTFHPAPHPRWIYSATFRADQVQFNASSDALHATTTVLVSPEDDIELRTLTLHNRLDEEVTIDVISAFEAVLADPRADEAHPAFSNLFIDTRWHPEWRALLLTRKPRLVGDPTISVAHFLADVEGDVRGVDYLADRKLLIGRNRSAANPALQPHARGEGGAPVNGLDPVAGLRVRLRVAAGGMARMTFATAAAESIDDLLPRIDKYLQPMHVERATRMAATLAQVRLRDLQVAPVENAALQDLNTALIYTSARAHSDRALIDQRQLWRFGLSGDRPLVLVRIHSSSGLGLVNALLRAQPLWDFGGLAVDLVVLNSEVNSYLMPLQNDILALRDRTRQQVENSFPRGQVASFHLLRDLEVSASEKATLAGLARVVFVADGRPLEQQLAAMQEQPELALPGGPGTTAAAASMSGASPAIWQTHPPSAVPELTPQGRFDADTGEFSFDIDNQHKPPRPWVNVIANAGFGFQVSESGSGYTWATNSRLHQVTTWSNDPVGDPSPEHYLLQDLDTRKFLALTPGTRQALAASHQVSHGQGYSRFVCRHGELAITSTFFADAADPVKVVRVSITHSGSGKRRLRALALIEWQLGAARHERRTIHTWKPVGTGAVFAQQRERRAGFGGSTGFALINGLKSPLAWTCDRSEFFNAAGRLLVPDLLRQQAHGGVDPCAAVASELVIQGGQTVEFAFVLGHAESSERALALAARWQLHDTAQALQGVRHFWSGLLGQVQVHTPDPLFDALVNRWLLYQTLASRLWSKAGFYQAGGAFGFRDQLQDAMAFAVIDPARLRQQILVNASRQFPEGDVQHWWHAPGGEGVRTHFSDDLLWLPYACAHYLSVTGEHSLLDETVPFLEGMAIPEGAEDAYYAPQTSDQNASVYEHCARAIDHSLKVGTHGLPLMGTGDWNDGMNRVGHEGRGESVWLAWFLCSVVSGFAPVAEARGESARAANWRKSREGWIDALHSHGWDGAWFRRAFFDNGAPLGAASEAECRIDLIAQAWAVLSGASSERFIRPALESMSRELIDPEAGLLHLLHPPFQHSANNPGYIQAYPPGVRENGGQYSHAAVWALMAQARTGDAEAAWESFKALSPAHRSAHPTRGPAYELEPYVMAGDIYGSPPYVGRGGWSWYTGSAAWLHRAAIETLIGLTVEPGRIRLLPCLPAHWPFVELSLNLQGHTIRLRWQRAAQPVPETAHYSAAVAEGEWIELDSLPQQAALLVHGAPSAAVTSDGELPDSDVTESLSN
jgi:cyclic beta-1,2-glucan synthetase